MSLAGASLISGLAAGTSETNEAVRLKPHQAISPGPPPKSPAVFNPDPDPFYLWGSPPAATDWWREVTISTNAPPVPPSQFNPDPGASLTRPPVEPPPLFRNDPVPPPTFTPPAIATELRLPRQDVRLGEIHPPMPPPTGDYGLDPLPDELQLPRENTRRNLKINEIFHPRDYSEGLETHPPHTRPMPDRWRVGFVPWKRYT
ncbi:MAG TPA: hypothetical protein VMS21_11865, partial [Methylomirabilota bacterium]|nr:hypothetical protein [Methylomirabilota bacterium]